LTPVVHAVQKRLLRRIEGRELELFRSYRP
jgi:hypothetical protein